MSSTVILNPLLIFRSTYTPPPASQVTVTTTLYPSGVNPSTITTTRTSSRRPTATSQPNEADPEGLVVHNVCEPGDAGYKVPGQSTLTPTGPAEVTLYAIAIMLVAGFIAWHLVLIRSLIYPVKLCVVAWHEFGHLAAVVSYWCANKGQPDCTL